MDATLATTIDRNVWTVLGSGSKETVESAMMVLKDAINSDPGYAIAWQSNVAMMCYDAINQGEITAFYEDSGEMFHEDCHKIANDAADRFMKLCFDLDPIRSSSEIVTDD